MAWIRRRKERKLAIRAARMLLALDGLASARVMSRRTARASLTTGR
ncbi:MAG: hypothetical protein WAQ33_01170 [Gaiellaceae bacterium]